MPPNNAPPSNSPAPSPPVPSPTPTSSPEGMPGKELLNPDEHVIAILHRHIVGLLIIYTIAIAATIALVALGYLTFPTLFDNLSGASSLVFALLITLVLAVLFLALFIATYIYRQSMIVITDKNIIQVLQKGLFIRKISRLAMSDVEDVTAEHRGILSSLFNYGILNIETAGEMKNFIFPYCPDPNKHADLILDARQAQNKK